MSSLIETSFQPKRFGRRKLGGVKVLMWALAFRSSPPKRLDWFKSAPRPRLFHRPKAPEFLAWCTGDGSEVDDAGILAFASGDALHVAHYGRQCGTVICFCRPASRMTCRRSDLRSVSNENYIFAEADQGIDVLLEFHVGQALGLSFSGLILLAVICCLEQMGFNGFEHCANSIDDHRIERPDPVL